MGIEPTVVDDDDDALIIISLTATESKGFLYA